MKAPRQAATSIPRHSIEHTCDAAPTWIIGARLGEDEENDRLRAECPRCRADDAYEDRIRRFEYEPLDPEEDLSYIAEDYPAEAVRLRAAQEVIKAGPVYKVVHRVGGDLRRDFLFHVAGGRSPDTFYEERVCECDSLDRHFDDGRPVYSRHELANQCRWCVVKRAFDEAKHEALTAAARAEHHAIGGQGAADRLRAVLRGEL